MLETEALLLDLLQHRAVLPEFARDASYAERDELLLRSHSAYSSLQLGQVYVARVGILVVEIYQLRGDVVHDACFRQIPFGRTSALGR